MTTTSSKTSTISTVSSPTATTTTIPGSPRLSPSHTRPRTTERDNPVPFKPKGTFDTPKRQVAKPKQNVQPKSRPPHVSSPSSEPTPLISIARSKTARSVIIEVQSDSEEDTRTVVVRPWSNSLPQCSPFPTNREDSISAVTSASNANASDLLPPSLVAILPEDSLLPSESGYSQHIHV